MPPPLRAARWLTASLVLASITGCSSDARPDTCDEPSVTLELELSADSLDPAAPAVCRDQAVTLVIASEVDGTIDLHGYDSEVPATQVSAGEELRLTFTAGRSGQFPIELHPAGDEAGVDVGIFTVHEP